MAAGEILNLLARANLAAAAAIVPVVALRGIARPWFGARLAYGLWLLPLLAAAAVVAPARVVTVAAQAPPPETVLAPLLDGMAKAGSPAPASAIAADPATVILALWLVGVAAAALVMALLQRRFTAEARRGAIGPAVVGIIAPRIVTPADFERKFSHEEQALVLAHERAHIERQDPRLNGLSAAIQCLCWFNPLVHLAAHLMRIDQEMACDEAVVTRFPGARRAYAQALVKAQLAIRPLPLGCYWPSGSEHPLLERIAMLKRNDLSRRRRLAGAAALAVLCAGAGAAAWASQPPQMRIAVAAAPTPAPAMREPPPAATPSEPHRAPGGSDTAAANLETSSAAATATPSAVHLVSIAAADPQPGGGQPASPAPEALVSQPNVTDAQRQALRDYSQCQRAAVKAADDGRASEDAVATEAEKRCEAQYQAYRQAWIASAAPSVAEERGWILDNGRQERARVVVHASRRANAMVADIDSCVRAVADQSGSAPFEQVVDRAVQRCGGLIPFPVAPIEHRVASTANGGATTATGQEPQGNHDAAIRRMMTFQLRRIAEAKAASPQ